MEGREKLSVSLPIIVEGKYDLAAAVAVGQNNYRRFFCKRAKKRGLLGRLKYLKAVRGEDVRVKQRR